MSNNTTMTFRPIEYEVEHVWQGNRSTTLNLQPLLGEGGQTHLRETLRRLQPREPLAHLQQQDQELCWERIDDQRYRLRMSELAEEKQRTGDAIQSMEVTLRLLPEHAEVRYETIARGTRTQNNQNAVSLPAAVRERAERQVARSVNKVIALSIADRLQQKVAQRAQTRLQERITIGVKNRVAIRATAKLR